jgi:methionyl-tRNA formyltransferase
MGTPEFAVPSLRILVENGYDIAAVVTATDKLGGRGGQQLIESAVKKYALTCGLPILQPEKLRSPDFLDSLQALQADLAVVVAFRMLPEVVWAMPRLGTINLHGSLLPRYRGAAPINWAIINGEQETGVTTFFLRQEIDTGDVLLQEKLAIGEADTAGMVHDRMMLLGAEVVLRSVRLIESGHYRTCPQDTSQASLAPKIFHETCRINFGAGTRQVHNFIRGLSPFPTAWTTLDGQELKIFLSLPEKSPPHLPPGTLLSDQKTYLKVATANGYIHLLELQLQGRKRMDVRAFLNGYRVENGSQVGG